MYVLPRGVVGGEGGEWMRGLSLDFTNPLGTGGRVGRVFWLRWCGCGWCRWVGGLDQGLERLGGVMSV